MTSSDSQATAVPTAALGERTDRGVAHGAGAVQLEGVEAHAETAERAHHHLDPGLCRGRVLRRHVAGRRHRRIQIEVEPAEPEGHWEGGTAHRYRLRFRRERGDASTARLRRYREGLHDDHALLLVEDFDLLLAQRVPGRGGAALEGALP